MLTFLASYVNLNKSLLEALNCIVFDEPHRDFFVILYQATLSVQSLKKYLISKSPSCSKAFFQFNSVTLKLAF